MPGISHTSITNRLYSPRQQTVQSPLSASNNFTQSAQTFASSNQFTNGLASSAMNSSLNSSLNFISPGKIIAADYGLTSNSKAINISLIGICQAIAEIFVGIMESTSISRIFAINSAEELLGSGALAADSILRTTTHHKLPIDKIMAFVQGSIGALLMVQLLGKVGPAKYDFLKSFKPLRKINNFSKKLLEFGSRKLNIKTESLLNFGKISLGLSSLWLAASKHKLAQNIQDPAQKDAFLRSMLIDLICSCEALLLFIPEGKALAEIFPALSKASSWLKGVSKLHLDAVVEKIYLLTSSLKLLSEALPKFLCGQEADLSDVQLTAVSLTNSSRPSALLQTPSNSSLAKNI